MRGYLDLECLVDRDYTLQGGLFFDLSIFPPAAMLPSRTIIDINYGRIG